MVVRKQKKNRKYFGSRRWGLGNIKNGRGAGDRGGVGKGGRKHKWTYITAKEPESIHKKGFIRWGALRHALKEITLREINRIASESGKSELDLHGYKVLSNGTLDAKITIKADSFSEKALEKIKSAGCSVVQYKNAEAQPPAATAK